MKNWLSDKVRFADFCNGILFQGNRIVLPEELEKVKGEADLLITDKNGKIRPITRYRDIVMKWKKNVSFVLLACESQDKVNYAMAVRNMVYDGLAYTEQINQNWREQNRKKKEGKISRFTEAEFLSGFRKEDVMRLEHVEQFQTDLGIVFQLMKYQNSKADMKTYIMEQQKYLSAVDEDTFHVLSTLLGIDKQVNEFRNKNREGIDMCKAMQEWYQDGINLGRKEGEKWLDDFSKLNLILLQDERYEDLKKVSLDSEYRQRLYQEYGIV